MRLRINRKQAIYIAAVWLLLMLSLYGNFFGVGLNKEWFQYFQEDSSLITEKTATCKGELSYDGPIIASDNSKYMDIMASSECDEVKLKPYDSQYGLQSRVVALFAPVEDGQLPRYFKAVELILAGLTALLLTAIIVWMRVRYGSVAAATLLTLLLLSPWIVGYAKNMYWIEPLMILPFVFGLIFYEWFRKSDVLWLFYLIELLLIFLKFLNGYEHASTLIVSVLVPIVFYEMIERKRKLLSLWKEALAVASVGVLAFGTAFFVNTVSLASYYGSWSEATSQIKSRSTARSIAGLHNTQPDVIANFEATLPDAYSFIDQIIDMDSLKDGNGPAYKYALVSIINYILLPAITLPFVVNGMFGVVLQSILTFALIGFLSIRRMKWMPKLQGSYRAFWYSYWLSLMGALSWLVLMPAHAYPHAHLNAIIFYMPFLVLCYMAIGIVIREYITSIYVSRRKK